MTKNYIIHLSKLYINNFCFKKLYNIWFIIIGVNNITVTRVVTVTSRDTLWLTSVPGVDVVVRHTQTQSLSQRIVYTSATHRPSEQKKQPQCCHDTCNWPAWLILDKVLRLDRVALSFCRTLSHQRYCVQQQCGEVHYLHFLWFKVRPGRDSKRNHLPLSYLICIKM